MLANFLPSAVRCLANVAEMTGGIDMTVSFSDKEVDHRIVVYIEDVDGHPARPTP